VGTGQAVKREWLRRWTCAMTGCRTFALDRRASRPTCTTSLRAIKQAAKPGGGASSPRTPLLGTTGPSQASARQRGRRRRQRVTRLLCAVKPWLAGVASVGNLGSGWGV
jgi:hypothetical protein